METFIVVETHVVTRKYEVTAESKAKAEEMVMNDEVQPFDEDLDNFDIESVTPKSEYVEEDKDDDKE